jgi:hypothetical protein
MNVNFFLTSILGQDSCQGEHRLRPQCVVSTAVVTVLHCGECHCLTAVQNYCGSATVRDLLGLARTTFKSHLGVESLHRLQVRAIQMTAGILEGFFTRI